MPKEQENPEAGPGPWLLPSFHALPELCLCLLQARFKDWTSDRAKQNIFISCSETLSNIDLQLDFLTLLIYKYSLDIGQLRRVF